MMCEYFICIQSQSYNCGDPDKCSEEDCYNCPCDYPLKYGCLVCGNYDEYDMICLKNKRQVSKGGSYEGMKVIRKYSNVCSFEDLDSGDVFKLSETGSLFMKIDNPDNNVLSSLDIETGRLYEMYSKGEVVPVDGYFVEGMVEHDA